MNYNYIATLPQIVVQFIYYQSNVKNKSELTLNEYCLDLRLFLRFLVISSEKKKFSDEELDAVDITRLDAEFFRKISLNDAYRFLSYCKEVRGNKERARARKSSNSVSGLTAETIL